ncbi:ABC-type transport system involved in cytochrome bd biosynthesis fused ATPase/permease subunit [Pantoea sp. AN62]|uniref:ABC transporter transmembrane domain-containing protein n=1 Tax=Pantoea TaxID=53335 RepID=UPI000A23DEF8|nr:MULTISPECIES: ABC transporter transmembrane domain-containing protein [Pantoea]MCQ5473156.1 ABC transporter transmembrane domain-containing protein [Pantoea brenneri]ORM50870.1 hypothetical protein HA39_22605 [Pantoea brenneri]OXM17744.1 hypothetical protein CBI35_23520 [Pantoea sp. AV62]
MTLLAGVSAQCGAFACIVLGGGMVMQALSDAPFTDVAGYLMLAALATALAWYSHDLAFALIETLQLGIFDGLARAAPAHIGEQRLGDIAATATRDAEMMERFYAHMLVDYLTAFLMPGLALLILLFIAPPLALIFLPCVVLNMLIPRCFFRRAILNGARVAEHKSTLNSLLIEVILGWRELQMSDATGRYASKLQQVGALRAAAKAPASPASQFARQL